MYNMFLLESLENIYITDGLQPGIWWWQAYIINVHSIHQEIDI